MQLPGLSETDGWSRCGEVQNLPHAFISRCLSVKGESYRFFTELEKEAVALPMVIETGWEKIGQKI